jgi:serine/threonine-protein kinase
MTIDRLGKYRILEELGSGGFATVYRALDTTLDREVALKVLHPQLLTDPTFIGRFKREARAMAKLDHQHIAPVYEVGEADGRVYIALHLARGPNLAEMIARRGRFSWRETLDLLQPVCGALDYAHSRGVVHRDLKPANILVDRARGPVLTDFGFARLVGESSASLSASGGILGTPAYIAPEIWELDAAEPAADVYALGCIAYEMLTGEVLFAGKTPMQAMRAHDRGPQFPEAWSEGVPERIEFVLNKALARDPAARYPGAGAFHRALGDLGAQAPWETAEPWRAEAEAAMAAGPWDAAKMAAAPKEPAADAQREIARRSRDVADGDLASTDETGATPPPTSAIAETDDTPSAERGAGLKARSRFLWIVGGIIGIFFGRMLATSGLEWRLCRQSGYVG